MKKLIAVGLVILLNGCTLWKFGGVEANTNINGNVESRCTVNTATAGYYGNPNAYTLTTLPASDGQVPVIRVDTSLANAYKAQISYPTSFSSSPSLGDSVTWTGTVAYASGSVSDMSGYQAASTTADGGAMRIYNLTVAGATWFNVTSVATYGGGANKAFPSGSYSAVVVAECIAQ
ncbi:hypothetical protein N9L33_03565 [Nitrospinae bacterium]|nr:hypothetical protein [Nitrospinota bacterium]